MTNEVVLSSALRSNLLSLQRTQSSIDKVQNVLATGLKVSSALDNPQNFFASQSLKNRSSDLTKLLDGIGQSIQTIKAADAGVTSLTKLVEQANSIVDSAREAVTSGGKEASVTGVVDLSGLDDLTTLPNVGAADELELSYIDVDGTTTTTHTVAIASGDSIEQFITAINDETDQDGNKVFNASLTSEGYLKITALNGRNFTASFDAGGGGSSGSAADLGLASDLGFGQIAKVTASGSATSAVEFTATTNTKLVSGKFYTTTVGEFADASALLTATRTTDGGSTARFAVASSATDAIGLEVTVNDESTATISISSTTTIQGLVDGINNDATLSQYIKADYDAETGEFTIEATEASVQTIRIEADENPNGGPGTAFADFDFGVDGQFAVGAANGAEGETFVLASAASLLSQYEDDYNQLLQQIDGLVSDSGYRGVNLINGDDLNTFFNEDRSNKLTTVGSDLSSAGLGLSAANFSRLETIEAASTEVRTGLTALRSFGGTLANSLSIIQTRENFTKSLVETLNEGSDKLTIADQNEEGAKLLALQTRQQLGVTALSLAAQAQQSVLRLF